MSRTYGKDLVSRASELEQLHPIDILNIALAEYSPDLAIAFSGAEDIVLIDMAVGVGRPFRVISLDTGRLHPETYEFFDQVRDRYRINVELVFPQPQAVEKLVRDKGLFSFYRDGHQECCQIRKVEPLRRALVGVKAWVSGQRRDQSPSTRARVSVVEWDLSFGTPEQPLLKFNPLAHWSSKQVWTYIRERNIPYNSLHERGFVSIGCQPCTRSVLPGQHEREGRWWWEDATRKECGLHTEGKYRAAEDASRRSRARREVALSEGKPFEPNLEEL